jgi:ParB family chromosome partitioning protein
LAGLIQTLRHCRGGQSRRISKTEFFAMTKITLNTETFTVPLDKLEPDERNVRLTGREIDVPELAHNIAHEGLLHGLGVRPVLNDSGEPTGRYGVVIGGRRLAALKLLVKKQRLAKDEPVTCFAVKPAALTSAGLAENLQRVPMLGCVVRMSSEQHDCHGQMLTP